jgi:hypothetical protein
MRIILRTAIITIFFLLTIFAPGLSADVNYFDGWLSVSGTSYNGDTATRIGVYDTDNAASISGWWLSQNQDGNFAVHQDATGDRLIIDGSGNIGIGTASPQSKLAVNGAITAMEIVVTDTGWADYVFSDNYSLPSLDEVESFIKVNKHLPDMPSEKEVTAKGLSVSEMMTKQMQKIEELTLYVIALKKENDALKTENSSLQAFNTSFEERLSRLELQQNRK